jgi:hypothetical protein
VHEYQPLQQKQKEIDLPSFFGRARARRTEGGADAGRLGRRPANTNRERQVCVSRRVSMGGERTRAACFHTSRRPGESPSSTSRQKQSIRRQVREIAKAVAGHDAEGLFLGSAHLAAARRIIGDVTGAITDMARKGDALRWLCEGKVGRRGSNLVLCHLFSARTFSSHATRDDRSHSLPWNWPRDPMAMSDVSFFSYVSETRDRLFCKLAHPNRKHGIPTCAYTSTRGVGNPGYTKTSLRYTL